MRYSELLLTTVSCFLVVEPKNTSSCVKEINNNPVPALEQYFSRSLYQRLALQTVEGNLLVSPLGVDVLLATLLEGAQGEEQVNLTRLLGLDQVVGFPYCKVKIGYLQLLKNITSILQMSTRMYISKDYAVNEEFLSIANDYYHTGAEMLNLTNKQEAAKAINKDVEENTHHMITEVVTEGRCRGLDDFSEDSSMLCISTAHFQEQWAVLFPKQITSKLQFRSTPQTHSLVHMMHVKSEFHLAWNATLQAKLLALDFTTKNASMLIILPDEEDKLFDLEAKLANIDYIPLIRLVRSTPLVRVDLRMPRFNLQEDLDLRNTLQQMGLTKLFTSKANLFGISSRLGLHVSVMKQKSHLVVEENGVEVSSTEVVEADNGTKEEDWQEFHADHPFLFFLVIDEVVVFQGRLMKPSY